MVRAGIIRAVGGPSCPSLATFLTGDVLEIPSHLISLGKGRIMSDSWRCADTARRAAIESEICRCVQFALRGTLPSRIKHERRRERRHPYPYPIQLTPVDPRGMPLGESLCVIGKHLSNHGLDFYYQQPVPYRRVVAVLSAGGDQHVSVLMDLTWCRFSGHGWYENGGRFLAMYEPPAILSLPNLPALVPTTR